MTVRRGPLEAPSSGDAVAPGGVGLEAMVEPAQRGKVVGLGGARLCHVLGFGVVVVLGDVVDVAMSGGSGAPREDARAAESR